MGPGLKYGLGAAGTLLLLTVLSTGGEDKKDKKDAQTSRAVMEGGVGGGPGGGASTSEPSGDTSALPLAPKPIEGEAPIPGLKPEPGTAHAAPPKTDEAATTTAALNKPEPPALERDP